MKAYKDASDGYYQYDGEDTPAWAAGMTLTEVIVPVVIPPTYQELRASAYPPAADYLDAIVKGDTAQAQAYIDECLAVKAKYPK